MSDYTPIEATLTYTWVFDKMLPSLPGIGTPAFAFLCKDLQPYGISPSGITIESSSNRLSDVTLWISLLNEHVLVRVNFAWFEVYVSEMKEDDRASLSKIIEKLHTALRELDEEAQHGRTKVKSNSHITLPPFEADLFLREHLSKCSSMPELVPDAFAYKLKPDDFNGFEPHVIVAKSLKFPDSLFVQFDCDYSIIEPEKLVERVAADIQKTLTIIGLKRIDALER